jgi:hypothetical protein
MLAGSRMGRALENRQLGNNLGLTRSNSAVGDREWSSDQYRADEDCNGGLRDGRSSKITQNASEQMENDTPFMLILFRVACKKITWNVGIVSSLLPLDPG